MSSPPRLETIVVTVRSSGVCLIEFNRPHRGNAFNPQLSRVRQSRHESLFSGLEDCITMGHCK